MFSRICNVSAWGMAGAFAGFTLADFSTYSFISVYCGGPRTAEPQDSSANIDYFKCTKNTLNSISYNGEVTGGLFSIPNIIFTSVGFVIGLAYGIYNQLSINSLASVEEKKRVSEPNSASFWRQSEKRNNFEINNMRQTRKNNF